MGKKVQTFLRDNNIDFHAFNLTSSKSKFAEGAIRLIRTEMKRLQRFDESGKFRWWNYLQVVVDNLNAQPIVVDGKILKFAPRDVNEENLEDFKNQNNKYHLLFKLCYLFIFTCNATSNGELIKMIHSTRYYSEPQYLKLSWFDPLFYSSQNLSLH